MDKSISELIDKMIEEKIKKLVDEKLDNIFSNNEPVEADTLSKDDIHVDTAVDPEFNALNEVKKGWVETTNGYMDVIESMKRALTKEQLDLIATPREFVSAKEFNFHNFLKNMSWEDLSNIFKNNKYMPINIEFDDDQKNKFMMCGTTPQMIYITLLTDIVKAEVVKMTKSEKSYDPENYALHAIILGAYHELYNNDIVNTLTNTILAKCHMEVFDDVFGERWYAPVVDLREIYADKINKKDDGTGEEIHTSDDGTVGQEDVG